MSKFLEQIFSVKNEYDQCCHKVISLLGIKMKFKVKVPEMNKSWISRARSLGVKLGENNVFIGNFNWGNEPYLIEIGDNNLISLDVTFLTHDGSIHTLNNLYNDNISKVGKIIIKNNCFIGCKSIILPNVCIGNNAILAAGSVLTKDIPDNEVWAGNPAKKICTTQELYLKQKNKYNTSEYAELMKICSYYQEKKRLAK